MKIALIGATGFVGPYILQELMARGHEVTAIVRDPDNVPRNARVHAVSADATDAVALAPLLRGHDAVVASVQFRRVDPSRILRAVALSKVERYLVVGGAGTLRTASGGLLMDAPDFPAEWLSEPQRAIRFLDELKAQRDVNWTFLSPSALLSPGGRTGRYRLGTDDLIVGCGGRSHISTQDLAVALADELDQPQHLNMRFTAGY